MIERIGLDKFTVFLFCILSALIFLGVFNNSVAYITLLLNMLVIARGDSKHIFAQLFFLLPFAMVYKSNPSSTSFLTYIMMISAVALTVRNKSNLLALFPIGIYMLVGGIESILLWVKVITGFILLLSFIEVSDIKHIKAVVVSFSFGLLISSLIGTQKLEYPQLASFFSDFNEEYIGGIKLSRFSALYLDPNFYSISIIMSVYLLVNFAIKKILPPYFVIFIVVFLIYYGSLSYSKMFILALALVLISQLWTFVFISRYKMVAISGVTILLFLLSYSFFSSAYFEGFSSRLDTDDLSSNRTFIWSNYLQYLYENPVHLLLGSGLGSPLINNSETHNTYIEVLYYLGIVGSIIYLFTIRYIYKKKQLVLNVPSKDMMLLYVFCVMITTLHVLLVHDLMFYLILIWISFNISYYENSTDSY